jgi:hypothetical protein
MTDAPIGTLKVLSFALAVYLVAEGFECLGAESRPPASRTISTAGPPRDSQLSAMQSRTRRPPRCRAAAPAAAMIAKRERPIVARPRPAWPRRLRSPRSDRLRPATWPGDRLHAECRRDGVTAALIHATMLAAQ